MNKLLTLLLLLLTFYAYGQHTSERFTQVEADRQALFIKGSTALVIDHNEEAIEIFQKLEKEQKQNDAIRFQLSRAYKANKQFEKAIQTIKKATESSEHNVYYLLHLADCYAVSEQYKNAAQTFEQLSEIEPREKYYENAVTFFLKDRLYEEASLVLSKMESTVGISHSIVKQQLNIYKQTGETKKAVSVLQKILKRYPKNTSYLVLLAEYYTKLDKSKKAKQAYQKVLTIDPNNSTALANLGRGDASSTFMLQVSDKSLPLDKKITLIRNKLKSDRDIQKDELNTASEQLAQDYPEDSRVYFLKGDILKRIGKLDLAAQAYQKALDMDATVFEVWNQLMNCKKQLGLFDKLVETSEQAFLRYPNQVSAYLYHSRAHMEVKNWEDAQEFIEEAESYANGNQAILNEIKLLKARLMWLRDAKIVDLNESDYTNNADFWDFRGSIMQGKNPQEASKAYQKALQIEPYSIVVQKKLTNVKGM